MSFKLGPRVGDTRCVGKVRVHCYGCSRTVEVGQSLPAEGLRIARWCTDHGQTFCPACAKSRGLEDPWGARDPWSGYEPRPDNGHATAAEVVPAGPAIDDQESRVALTRYGRRAWLWLLAGAALFGVTLTYTQIRAHQAAELLRTGVRTHGVVEAYEWQEEGGEIRVRYATDGSIREGSIRVGQDERYEQGEPIKVIYDLHDPARIRTTADANASRLGSREIMYGFLFSVLILGSGVTVMVRPLRWRRLMRSPWKACTATYLPGKGRRAGPGIRLAPAHEPAESVSLRLDGTLRGRAAKLAHEPTLWVAGDIDQRVVIAIPRTRELFSARVPRGWLGRQWLAAQSPPTRRERRAARVYLVLIAFCTGVGAIALASHHAWLPALLLATNTGIMAWAYIRPRHTN